MKGVVFAGIAVFILVSTGVIFAQNKSQNRISAETYIATYKDVAIAHMEEYGIPASIKLAQGILESAFGNSELAVNANNHFGIKCHNWEGDTYHKDDDYEDECFRKYDDPLSSFTDHSLFLTTRARYARLFTYEITDYKSWAHGLREAGYATNPRYPELLINIIERYSLYRFDTEHGKTSVAETDKRPKETIVKPASEKPQAPDSQRQIQTNNHIRYIKARAGDTPEIIAKDLEVRPWQIYRYNEFEKDVTLEKNQIVYLQPKRRRSFEYDKHTVTHGETLFDVSQKYGIKTRHLFRMNPNIHPDGILYAGQVIVLRRSLFGR